MRIVALIAAHQGENLIGPTVEAARSIPKVDEVIVVDDGSTDATAAEAVEAGARVLMSPHNLGKGDALDGAVSRLPPADVYVLLDQDLEETAAAAHALLEPVLAGEADVAIGVLPRQANHGGFRIVKGLSSWMIRRLTGFETEEPMSGQRALTRQAMGAVRPLARGFGVELGMTVDAIRAGLRFVEVPVAMTHAPTGRDLAGFVHRSRQGAHHLAAALRRIRPR